MKILLIVLSLALLFTYSTASMRGATVPAKFSDQAGEMDALVNQISLEKKITTPKYALFAQGFVNGVQSNSSASSACYNQLFVLGKDWTNILNDFSTFKFPVFTALTLASNQYLIDYAYWQNVCQFHQVIGILEKLSTAAGRGNLFFNITSNLNAIMGQVALITQANATGNTIAAGKAAGTIFRLATGFSL